MTDLTEQWKERSTQEDKHYYIKDSNEKVYIDFYWGEGWLDTPDEDIREILAEVPTFEEWKQLKEYERIVTSYNMKPIDYEIACETVNKLLDERKAFKEENTKLKELLKECKGSIATLLSKRITEVNGINQKELLSKINQALGEDK